LRKSRGSHRRFNGTASCATPTVATECGAVVQVAQHHGRDVRAALITCVCYPLAYSVCGRNFLCIPLPRGEQWKRRVLR